MSSLQDSAMVELGELGGEKWCHYNAAAARLYMKPRPEAPTPRS